MSAEPSPNSDAVETVDGFPVHAMRNAVLGELHARPFTPLGTPARIRHYAFVIEGAEAAADREMLTAWCKAAGLDTPTADAKHHRVSRNAVTVAWEQHTEFATWTLFLDGSGMQGALPEPPSLAALKLRPQGRMLVAIDLEMGGKDFSFPTTEDTSGMAAASLADGKAMVTLNFKPDASGHVCIKVRNIERSG
jgi:uncharacterized membrane-anchored protein